MLNPGFEPGHTAKKMMPNPFGQWASWEFKQQLSENPFIAQCKVESCLSHKIEIISKTIKPGKIATFTSMFV